MKTETHYHTPLLLTVADTLGAAVTRLRDTGSRFVRQMQIGRMHSVLASMSDVELARIGAERHDLRAHAERLMAQEDKPAYREYDGL